MHRLAQSPSRVSAAAGAINRRRTACAISHSRDFAPGLSPLASVVMEITTPKEILMSTKLKIAVVAVLLLASAPTAFAQRAPGQGSATISHTSQDSGPF